MDEIISAVRFYSKTKRALDCFVFVLSRDVEQVVSVICGVEKERLVADWADVIEDQMDDLGVYYKILWCDYEDDTEEPSDYWEYVARTIDWNIPVREIAV